MENRRTEHRTWNKQSNTYKVTKVNEQFGLSTKNLTRGPDAPVELGKQLVKGINYWNSISIKKKSFN